jgi:zinc/manganese transport system substrate-binding protein
MSLVRIMGGLAAAATGAALIAGCAGGGPDEAKAPDVVVTTSVLGDIVQHLVGADAQVEVIMPAGTDPHDFAPSARQVQDMREAHVLVVNGLHFEHGLDDTIAAAADDGTPVLTLADHIPNRLTLSEDGDAVPDPHVFNDPARMAVAVEALGTELAKQVDGLDSPAFAKRVRGYVASLRALDAEVEQTLAVVSPGRRVLVTNHEALGYFADRYGFEVLGTVIPSLSTLGEASAGQLASLATKVRDARVPAIFADTSSPTRLADALAQEVGHDVQVVELYVESLGPRGSGADTYLGMLRTNAKRIADALDG